MPRRRYKFDLYNRGVSATTGTITRTWESSRLADGQPLIVGGQTVRPTEGRTESEPFTIRILDVNSTVSGLLTDSSGRNHLLSRLFRVRRATDSTASTAYKTLSVGRVQDVSLAPDVASYDFVISDERWVERNTEIFTKANTAMLIPPGLIARWGPFPATTPAPWKVIQILGNLVCLRYDGPIQVPRSEEILSLIEEDVIVAVVGDNTAITTGNFTHLRWRNTGNATDYEPTRFGAQVTPGQRPRYPFGQPVTKGLRADNADGERDTPQSKFYVWVVWTSSVPSLDSTVKGYLYMPTHPPTEELPLHIGGSTGKQPFTLASTIYAGTYSATTSLTVRKSTAAFAKLIADARYGRVWFRITRPWNMADFTEQRLYQPYGVVPMVDSSGKISPVSMTLPPSTAFTVASLPKISSTNAVIHPTWVHPSREVVNVIRAQPDQYVYIFDTKNMFSMPADRLRAGNIAKEREVDVDIPGEMVETFDTTTLFGRRMLSFSYGMLASNVPGDVVIESPFPAHGNAQPQFKALAQAIFNRYGDGPIYTDFEASTGIDATTNGKREPGSFLKVVLATYPNAGANARGSTRVMQLISRRDHPEKVSGTLLDMGPALNAMAAPGVALALSTLSSRHAVVATVSTALQSGAKYQLEMGYGATTSSTAPVSWRAVEVNTTANRVFTLGQIPSHTKVFGRVKATKPTRIDSAYSTVSSVETASIAGPSAATYASVTAGSAILKWTNGSTRYPVEVMVDASTSATLGSSNRVNTVLPGTTRYDLLGLNSNDSHKAGVRHADPYGGYSTTRTVIFTTTTGYSVAPSMRGLVVVRGG